jgi:signal transduction histidine kinase/ActR/RegA family two-component response regulator
MERWFDVHAFPTGAAGENRVAILFNDITSRKLAEAELRRLNQELEERVEERSASLRLYRNIVYSDESPVVAFDTSMRITAFNRAHGDAYLRVYGIQQQIGDSLLEQFVPEQAKIVKGFMARALSGESFIVREEFGDPTIEKPHWQISYNPLRDDEGVIIGGFHHAVDITAELRAEDELKRTQDALRQSQKMEAVGQLTGGLAHDFNNLLTGMMGNLELLQKRLTRGRLDDLDRFILAAQGAGRRAASLTQRLLAFSRRQTLDPKPTEVNRLIAGMEDLLRRTVGPTTDIEIVGAAGLWTANIDGGQLENALLNLCINARDAMPVGGRIMIETANEWLDERTAGERDLAPGKYFSICVTDTGTGMSPEIIERVFEPFFTTKPLGEGTGLGLSMIYGFARQSNGQVRIHSEVDQGTTVCINLPRYIGDALMPEEEEAIASTQSASGQTILVVDDEATIRHLIDEVLDEAGYTVIGAADGAAGIKVLQSGARIELLITDVGLPGGMNGRQVADAARALRPGLKVLFITGYAENAAVGNGHLEPGMELLTKPFTMEAITAKVADMVKRN